MNTPLVSITFDDGRLTAVLEGSKILESFGVRGTYYIVTDYLGKENEHGKFADWADIERLAKKGHEIGNHSHQHEPDMVDWSSNKLEVDILKAQALFEQHNILSPITFSYPFGEYTNEIKQIVKNLGFSAARTIDSGYNLSSTDEFCLKSFMLEDKHGVEDIEKKIKSIKQKNAWLILTFHHLGGKSYLSTPPKVFKDIVKLITRNNISIVTVKEGINKNNKR